jgi:hypothetical protein
MTWLKQLYGWLYFLYLKFHWRRLRRMSADEYVHAMEREVKRKDD